MEYTQAEILQTVAMTEMEHLDVRTVTLGLSLLDCASDSLAGVAQKAGDKIRKFAARLAAHAKPATNEPSSALERNLQAILRRAR